MLGEGKKEKEINSPHKRTLASTVLVGASKQCVAQNTVPLCVVQIARDSLPLFAMTTFPRYDT